MSNRTVLRSSVEYLSVTLTADQTLDAQAVAISVDDRATWINATALGSPGTTRTYQVLLDGTTMPTAGRRQVFVKIVDSPETPVFAATGTCQFI